MALAFERWIARQEGISGAIGAGGSGAASLVAPGFRQLPVGVPKIIVSSVASGQTKPYVGGSDIMMMHSVADIQGLNSITRDVLGNAAEALAGMVKARESGSAQSRRAIGLSMFGVTTPAVQQLTAALGPGRNALSSMPPAWAGRRWRRWWMRGGFLPCLISP